jgi:hypothetical protein
MKIKTPCFVLAFVLPLFASVGVMAQNNAPSDPQAAYEKAVQDYISAASTQVEALHTQVKAEQSTARARRKEHYQKVSVELKKCDELLGELKKADQSQFDKVKVQFEQARAQALESLAAAREG